MKKLFYFLSSAFAITAILASSSCDTDLTKIDTKPAESALEVLKTFSDIIITVDDGLIPDSTKSGMKMNKKDYTETITGDFPNKEIRWDFGADGDYQGVIIMYLTDEYTNPSAVVQVSFENFLYKNKPVDGVVTFENLGKNNEDMDEYTVELNQTKVGTNELSAAWKLQRTAGGETPDPSDDLITLSQVDQNVASGITDEGVSFTLKLENPLVLDLSCEFIITKGIFEMVFSDSFLKADFGQGECDRLVNVSNGVLKADLYL